MIANSHDWSTLAEKESFVSNTSVVHNVFLSSLALKALTKAQQLVQEQQNSASSSGLSETHQEERVHLVKKHAEDIFRALTEQAALRGYVPWDVARAATLESMAQVDANIEESVDMVAKAIASGVGPNNPVEGRPSPVSLSDSFSNNWLMGKNVNVATESPSGPSPENSRQLSRVGTGISRIPVPNPGDGDEASRFTKLGELGSGGYGRVTLIHDRLLDRPYALKEITFRGRYSERNVERTIAEARALALMSHGNVIRIYTAWSRRQPSMGILTSASQHSNDDDSDPCQSNDSNINSWQSSGSDSNHGITISPFIEPANEESSVNIIFAQDEDDSYEVIEETNTGMSPEQIEVVETSLSCANSSSSLQDQDIRDQAQFPPAARRHVAFAEDNNSPQRAPNMKGRLPTKSRSLSIISLRGLASKGHVQRSSRETWHSKRGVIVAPPCISVSYTMDYHPINLEHFVFPYVREDNRDKLSFYFKDGQPPGFCGHLLPALDLISAMADGIAHVHSHKVVHRDLKPANILISLHSEKPDNASFADLAACPHCAAGMPPCSSVGTSSGPVSSDSRYRYAVPHITDFGTAMDAENSDDEHVEDGESNCDSNSDVCENVQEKHTTEISARGKNTKSSAISQSSNLHGLAGKAPMQRGGSVLTFPARSPSPSSRQQQRPQQQHGSESHVAMLLQRRRARIRGFPGVTRGYDPRDRRPTFRTDVYALGVMCLEILGGATTNLERAALRQAGRLGRPLRVENGGEQANCSDVGGDGVIGDGCDGSKDEVNGHGGSISTNSGSGKTDDESRFVYSPALDREINHGIAAMCARDASARWDLQDVRAWISRLRALHAQEFAAAKK